MAMYHLLLHWSGHEGLGCMGSTARAGTGWCSLHTVDVRGKPHLARSTPHHNLADEQRDREQQELAHRD